MANRLRGRYGYPSDEPFKPGTLHADKLSEPLRWRKPRRVFVCSMGDLFHKDVPFEYIAAVFGVIAACPQHTFLLLTKGPEWMARWFEWAAYYYDGMNTTEHIFDSPTRKEMIRIWVDRDLRGLPWPLPNVMLGVTAEDQQRADERWDVLRQIPAAVHWISGEPLLSGIDMSGWETLPDWFVAGGETGPGARPMQPAWARSLRDQCAEAGVPFFFKKVGRGRETPPDLAIREWPEVRHG